MGEQISVVIAETPFAAADGAEAVGVEYAPLPAVANWEAALKPGAPRVHSGVANIVAHLFMKWATSKLHSGTPKWWWSGAWRCRA